MLRRATLTLLLIGPGFAQQQPTLTFEVVKMTHDQRKKVR